MSQSAPSTRPTRSADVRRAFVEFFESKGHTFVPSAPVVPHDDPTLLFINAGMNQFKPVFQEVVPPGSPLEGLTRAVNSQKCIRAGGKHNDLEDVGRDTYHHTFFEMLGNWSFGDYFKDETIAWAWELITGVYALDPARLYATYFGGDEEKGLEPDLEARDLWLRFLPPERVLPFGMKDNFWEMGDTGPCGPCSELHYDRVGGRDASMLVNMDDDSVIEIWNLVFIQFDRQADASLLPLPRKHVDTGMGLERIVSVLQDKPSNYDTDLFLPLFAAIERITGCPHGYRGKLGREDADGRDMAYRVIADHVRTLTFAITDGATPSNEGRGYVLRRILRRAVRFGRQTLGAKPGFFARLVPTVVETMGEAFPELKKDPQRVIDIIAEEEESFGKTLDRGIKRFGGHLFEAINLYGIAQREAGGNPRYAIDPVVNAGAGSVLEIYDNSSKIKVFECDIEDVTREVVEKYFDTPPVISGTSAFELYDTYGFPVDLTQLMAEERGLRVDLEGFEREMEAQKERSRAGAKGGSDDSLRLEPDQMARLKRMNVPDTDDSHKFHGRDIRATVKAIWNGHNFDEHADLTTAGTKRVALLLDKTNFYSEMGGQVPDHGRLLVMRETRSNASDTHHGGEFRVEDVQAFGGYVLHIGRVTRGEVRVGDDVQLHIDNQRRLHVASNHTATHLLNLALRQVLGEGCDQKGSLVADDRLRFDFARSGSLSPEQLAQVQNLVAQLIEQNLEVSADLADLDAARKINGLRAVFGETYPNPVRVVSIGAPVSDLLADPESDRWAGMSVEFCGGTHLERTGQAEAFALISEEPVAKGVRRVVALTGVPARAAHQAGESLETRFARAEATEPTHLGPMIQELMGELEELTLAAPKRAELRARLKVMQEKVKQAKKDAAKNRAQAAQQMATRIAESAGMEPVIVSEIDLDGDRVALQAAMGVVTQACPTSAVMLLSTDEDAGSVSVVAASPKASVEKGLKAGDWVREVTGVMGGKGGGKPDAAQGAGKDPTKLSEAISAARRFALERLM
ncbi:MAG: alanine--tRNA ligase [Phycisphaerales bacterium JB059]